jgi:hypothetical protein
VINVRFVDVNGEFIHSTDLPEMPIEGHFVRIHQDLYAITRILWQTTRSFPYQKAGLEVILSPRTEDNWPL